MKVLFIFARLLRFSFFCLILFLFSLPAFAEDSGDEKKETLAPSKEAHAQLPAKVDVNPMARDYEIRQRLDNILRATDWFSNTRIEVREGVVSLYGNTENNDLKKWAGDLARNTQDVVAVINKISVSEPSFWDFEPSLSSLRQQWIGFQRAIPTLIFGLLIAIFAVGVARLIYMAVHRSLRNQFTSALLQDVVAGSVALFILLIGLYVVFQLFGLTTLALTVMGGTGILGIILGIAFRDITENLLASIFLSVQHPFRNGDLVEIEGILGYVQKLTMRVTVLTVMDGTQAQIPNATVYKSLLRNFTSNQNRRIEFLIGIGYHDDILLAQKVALKVLDDHSTVLKDPEPWVLVESLKKSVVELHIYFWVNSNEFNWMKVKSSVIRSTKQAFHDANISIPGEKLFISFPEGVPVIEDENDRIKMGNFKPNNLSVKIKEKVDIAEIENDLSSDAQEIQELGSRARPEDTGKNLLK